MTPYTVDRLLVDRRAGDLDDGACRAALAGLGFEDGGAALQALDPLIALPPDDLSLEAVLAGAIDAPDPGRALINCSRLLAGTERPRSPVPGHALARFLGSSQHMADVLLARPELLGELGRPFAVESAAARYRAAAAGEDRESALRRQLQVDLLAIAWEDLIEGLDIEQVTTRLSRLADAVVAGAALALGVERHFAIIALGKLGGSELNYSSDIDLMFVRPDTAADQPSADAVARAFVRLLSSQTPDGHLYRVDMRLRPEGGSGQLTRTVSSCLQYYREVGRPWERQMLTKARVVFDAQGAGSAFLRGTREWILACGLDAGAIRQFKRLKAATEAHHARSEERADVKQAPGGIRDIETIVQFLGLLHVGSQPGLISPSTLRGLERLRVAGAIDTLEAARLRSAYRFHRRVENLLQVMHRVQTHRLPADRGPLARLMHMRNVQALDDELAEHRRRVRAIFERHFSEAFGDLEGPAAAVAAALLDERLPADAALAALAELGFARPEAALAALRRAAAPVSRFLPASPRLAAALASFAPALLERLALAHDADAALDRFEAMTRGVGAREILYDRLTREPRLAAMLLALASASSWLTEMIAGEPAILDDVIDALLTGTRGRNLRRQRLESLGRDSDEDPWLVLSDHKKLETLRIGAQDLLDAVPVRQTLAELSQVCIDVLRHSYRLVLAAAERDSGTPSSLRGVSGRVSAGMVVVAIGKLGGLEANYASDADVMFVYSADGETDRGTPNSVFFARVAEEFIARVTGARGSPRLYRVDTRLRPEGAKGPLVTSLRALEAYYRSPRAALFERQALLKARIVAGDAELGQRVLGLVRTVVRGLEGRETGDLAAQLREMRARIEASAQGHDLKRGAGGMVDIEFIVQYLQLKHGAERPSLLAPETPRALELLAESEVLPAHVAHGLRDTYLQLRRIETRLQVALGLDTKEIPHSSREARSLALRLGYADSAQGDAGHELLTDLENAAAETRRRYEELLA